jgi:hypothetical protein
MADITRILHEWTVSIDRQVEETTTEDRDGQKVTVTRKVTKPVVTRMALKHPSRRELRQAELFYGKEFNRFVTMGFLPRSILINKHLDLTGGILSQKERTESVKLTEKLAALEADLVRCLHEPEEVKAKIRADMAAARMEISNINAANESVFSQTAEAKAQAQLNLWFAFHLTLIDRNGWVPYFEGADFDKKEEFMWKLEEDNDAFYNAAADRIMTYITLFGMGANTTEQFKTIEDEMKKQLDARKKEDSEKPVESTPEPAGQ